MSMLWKVSTMAVPFGWEMVYTQSAYFGYLDGYEGEVTIPLRAVKSPPHAPML